MNNLVREQRVDKNGAINTKLVRAAPKASNAMSRVPAPSLGSNAPSRAGKSAEKPYKPRASQLKSQRYSLAVGTYVISDELKKPVVDLGTSFYSFEATEVQVLDVLSAVSPGDALELLQQGIRSGKEARTHLGRRRLKHLIKDQEEYTQEALRRNISSYSYMENINSMWNEHRESPYFMDALEFRTIASIEDQYHWVKSEVLSGKLRLDDIKTVGASKLKSYRRLTYSLQAFEAVNEDGAKFTLDDLRSVIDRSAEQKINDREYKPVVDYLIHEGPEFLAEHSDFKALFYADRSNTGKKDRRERTKYELNFKKLSEAAHTNPSTIARMYEANVPFEVAARMMNDGDTADQIIAVVEGGIHKPLADGWL